MICYNLGCREEMKPLLAEAAKRDVGIIGMKSWREAAVENPTPPTPDRWAQTVVELLKEERVATILRGMACAEGVAAFAPILHRKVGRRGPGMRRLERAVSAGVCSMCGACECCPAGVRIQDVLRYAQYGVDGNAAHAGYAPAAYARLQPDRSADACRNCGTCEAACPKGLNVRQQLAQAHALLTGKPDARS